MGDEPEEESGDGLGELDLDDGVVVDVKAEGGTELSADAGGGDGVGGGDLGDIVVGRGTGVSGVAGVHQLTGSGEGACVGGSLELVGPEFDAADIDGEAAETHEDGEDDDEINEHRELSDGD